LVYNAVIIVECFVNGDEHVDVGCGDVCVGRRFVLLGFVVT